MTGDGRWAREGRKGITSSTGTFSPSVRFSFASRFLRVSVAVGVDGVRGVVGVIGIADRAAVLTLFSVAAVSGVARRGSEGGSATAFNLSTRGVGRGVRFPLLFDFSRTWRANDFGAGSDWVDSSESFDSMLDRGVASELIDELAEEDA